MANNIAISVDGLTIRYKSAEPVVAAVSFLVKQGEFTSLIGRSGTGKTSILNAIAGFISFEGTIERKGRFSYVFQRNALFPFMTVAGNIGFGLSGLGRAERDHVIKETLDLIGLPGFGARYPSQLSGGQAQRVALGQALAVRPDIILLDEAFAALDVLTRDQLTDWLRSLVKTVNVSVLMTSHYLDEVITLSQQVLILSGRQLTTYPMTTNPERFSVEFQTVKQQLSLLL